MFSTTFLVKTILENIGKTTFCGVILLMGFSSKVVNPKHKLRNLRAKLVFGKKKKMIWILVLKQQGTRETGTNRGIKLWSSCVHFYLILWFS